MEQLGGIIELVRRLGTDTEKGIEGNENEIAARASTFGKNEFPVPESETWIGLFIGSFNDATLIILIVAAVVSLAVGLYEDLATGWIEGAAILISVVVVACVTATNDYNKEAQFKKLNAQKDDITVTVVRNGSVMSLNTKALVVGDLIKLNAGDKVPCH